MSFGPSASSRGQNLLSSLAAVVASSSTSTSLSSISTSRQQPKVAAARTSFKLRIPTDLVVEDDPNKQLSSSPSIYWKRFTMLMEQLPDILYNSLFLIVIGFLLGRIVTIGLSVDYNYYYGIHVHERSQCYDEQIFCNKWYDGKMYIVCASMNSMNSSGSVGGNLDDADFAFQNINSHGKGNNQMKQAQSMHKQMWNPGFLESMSDLDIILSSSISHAFPFAQESMQPGIYVNYQHHSDHNSNNNNNNINYHKNNRPNTLLSTPRLAWPTGKPSDVSLHVHGIQSCTTPPTYNFQPFAMSSFYLPGKLGLLAVLSYSREDFINSRYAIELFNITRLPNSEISITWIGCIPFQQETLNSRPFDSIKISSVDDRLIFILSSNQLASSAFSRYYNNHYNHYDKPEISDPRQEGTAQTKADNNTRSRDYHRTSSELGTIIYYYSQMINQLFNNHNSKLSFQSVINGFYSAFGMFLDYLSRVLQNFGWNPGKIQILAESSTISHEWEIINHFDLPSSSATVEYHENHVYYIDTTTNSICRRHLLKSNMKKSKKEMQCSHSFPNDKPITSFVIWPKKRKIIALLSEADFWTLENCIMSGYRKCVYNWSLQVLNLKSMTFDKTLYDHDGSVFGAPTSLKMFKDNFILGSRLSSSLAVVSWR